MPFKRVFERNVNRNMQEGEQGPAPNQDEVEESKTEHPHDTKEPEYEIEDEELSEKKDRPPRFSTLFAPTPPPQVIERIIESPKKRSGVYLPTPLFVVLAFILFFESTLLFAYTIIGLYNNMPAGILPFGSPSPVGPGCPCLPGTQGINISPNFIMPGANGEVQTVTATAPLPSTSASTETTTATTSSPDAAKLLSLLTSAIDPTSTEQPGVVFSTKVVTSTPEQETITSSTMKTVIAGQPRVTSTKIVDPTSSANAEDLKNGHYLNFDTEDYRSTIADER
ncbi:hypothetical protein LTR37_009053 [Vermiconidia calcicola]|uniref:Uncharacterized protein n=1 Tax=Vermiconidia calcicola TaxID=1690605 RepID=A0ACC3NBS9_9PEZI|nr:hypothetical protein LTR37_009053 [Vermiconidia calcicola]